MSSLINNQEHHDVHTFSRIELGTLMRDTDLPMPEIIVPIPMPFLVLLALKRWATHYLDPFQ